MREPDPALSLRIPTVAFLAEAALAAVPLPLSDPDTEALARLPLRIDALFRTPVIDSERRYVTLDARIVRRPHLEGE